MGGFKIKESAYLREKYFYKTHESGLTITYVPKDVPQTFAVLCVDFGAEDIEYEKGGEKFVFPSGTAHFLEHKIFENADGSDALASFSRLGGSANAFTSFENTCFYFSCTDNFYENLEVLLSTVSKLHVTEKSVNKEKKIIAREIKMYEDSPLTVFAHETLAALFENHPLTLPVSGTEATIADIDAKTLERAFDDFYIPANMSLCVCGKAETEKIDETVSKYFKQDGKKRPKTLVNSEDGGVVKKDVRVNADVAVPRYFFEIKCAPPKANDLADDRRATAIKIGLNLLFGLSSEFFEENHILLQDDIYTRFSDAEGASHISLYGTSDEPEEVEKRIIDTFLKKAPTYFTDEEFIREKRATFAEEITLFDSAEDTAIEMAEAGFLDYDAFDCREIIRDVTADEVREALAREIDLDKHVFCIAERSKKRRK